eukprot:EG_transcript_8085
MRTPPLDLYEFPLHPIFLLTIDGRNRSAQGPFKPLARCTRHPQAVQCPRPPPPASPPLCPRESGRVPGFAARLASLDCTGTPYILYWLRVWLSCLAVLHGWHLKQVE